MVCGRRCWFGISLLCRNNSKLSIQVNYHLTDNVSNDVVHEGLIECTLNVMSERSVVFHGLVV